jgi:hypothetical protein
MREVTFGTDGIVRLTGTRGGEVEAITTDGWRLSWAARLIKATTDNPLNLRWFRMFEKAHSLTMGTRQFRLREGHVYEVESAGPGGEPRLHALQIRGGDVAWVHCLTLDKRGGTERVVQALE